jgi:DNA-binding transcriptional ArsR family regulator
MRLEELISSRVRAEIFRLLFGLKGGEMHVREIERQSGLRLSTVRQDLAKLSKLDLVKARKDSNRLYYRANNEHPLYIEIHRLVLKTSGLVDTLKKALNHKEVKVAFVFGSIATNTDQAGSDVDLMIIGNVGLRKTVGWLSGASEQVGREINPHTMTIDEFKKRRNEGEHFLTRVLESPRLFVIGTEDELAGLG